MRIIAGRDVRPGMSIVTKVYIKTKDGRRRECTLREVQDTDKLLGIAKTLQVESITHGECGKGLHINERRISANRRVPTNDPNVYAIVPNANAGQIIKDDGCWDYAMRLWVE